MQHEVVVVAHPAVAQHLGIEALHRLSDHCEQAVAVVVAVEDRLAPVAPRGDVKGVSGTSASDVTVVGEGSKVAELAGTDWLISPAISSNSIVLNAVVGIGDETYVAGAYGTVGKKQRGAAWTEVRAPNINDKNLNAIWASGINDIIVAGDLETLMQGPTWTLIPLTGITPGTTNLRGVWGDAREVYVVGDNGTIVRRRDNDWQQLQPSMLPPVIDLTAVSGADGVVLAVGAAGTIWRNALEP